MRRLRLVAPVSRDRAVSDLDPADGSGASGDSSDRTPRDGAAAEWGRRYRFAVGIAIAVISVDRLTKEWAATALADGPFEIIPGALSLSLTENFGASFSMLQGAGPVLGIAAVGAAFVILLALRTATDRAEVVALALIMGGALGNLVDRIIRGDGFLDGGVIDFIALPNFPHFNVADSVITIGAALLIWSAIRKSD